MDCRDSSKTGQKRTQGAIKREGGQEMGATRAGRAMNAPGRLGRLSGRCCALQPLLTPTRLCAPCT